MPQKKELICIIDDDNIYINLVSKIIQLKQLSESVIIFKNGKEAIDFFTNSLKNSLDKKRIPDVILLDLNMPIMDGWEFLNIFSEIKNDEILRDTSLYVVSSSIDNRDINRAKSIEVVKDYLTKPIKLSDFEKILA